LQWHCILCPTNNRIRQGSAIPLALVDLPSLNLSSDTKKNPHHGSYANKSLCTSLDSSLPKMGVVMYYFARFTGFLFGNMPIN
jgi:hypothetical protein